MCPRPRKPDADGGIQRLSIYGQAGTLAVDLHLEAMQARAAALDYTVKPHVHPDMLQVMLGLAGVCEATIDGVTHQVAAPCMVSIPGGTAHCFNFGDDARGWILTTSHQRVLAAPLARNEDNVTALLRQPHIVTLAAASPHVVLISALFRQLQEELHTDHGGQRAGIEYTLRLILLHHWRAVDHQQQQSRHSDRDRQLFYDFRALVEQHFQQQWPITEYTRRLKCSQPRLNQVCREFSGLTANGVILGRLGEEARRLLAFTTGPAAHIGYRLGFQEPSYFTRFFKRQTGMTPGAFRANRDQG